MPMVRAACFSAPSRSAPCRTASMRWRKWSSSGSPRAEGFKELSMEKRALGNSGLSVAPLAFGGNVFGWTADAATSFSLLDAFVDAGCNLIDTADVYSRWIPGHSGGESETLIGQWLAKSGKRDRVLVATKVGMDMGPGRSGLSRGRIRAAVDESLTRMQTDHIDLYQSHVDDAATPFEETLATYAELIAEGK